jgi:large subunit ribosomal protein L13
MKGTIVNKKKADKPKGGEVRKVFTVDASGRTLGRVASEAASILLGKKSANYAQNAVLPLEVKVVNAGKLRISERRMAEKTYRWFTGQVDGLREITLPNLIAKKGIEYVVAQTVDGMIPRNKLRKERMKRLSVTK